MSSREPTEERRQGRKGPVRKLDLAEQREKVRRRLAGLGTAVDREVERAGRLKDAALVAAGVIGFLLTTRKLAKALGGRKDRRRSKKK